jgi:hypothetical protein
MKNVTGDDEWQTFNRRFDLLFGKDLQDAECCLLHICCGEEIHYFGGRYITVPIRFSAFLCC